ncbi:hypothetical protein A4G19_02885 [Pasteurellaceae bacterium Macca]|nr:hypothetical protein [Pasteurellaceae bacterium Macca]
MSAIFNLFYLYDPWLFHFFRMAFFVGLIAVAGLAYQLYRKQRPQGIIIPIDSFGVIIALIALSILPMALHQTKEFGVIVMYCKALILFTLGVAIYNLFYYREEGKTTLIRDLKIGIIIQAVVGFIALLGVNAMIDLALSTNVVLPRFYHSEQEYRLYNITSIAFFQLSLFYIVLQHFLLAYNAKNNTIPSIFFLLLLFIGLISGRTFLFLSAVSFLVYFKWRYIPMLFIFAGCCLFLAINFADNKYVLHALEPLINLLQDKGTISSSSENLVKNHLYIPQLKQILFGDGLYYTPTGGYYGATDSGFIRQVLYGGIGYLSLCFLFTAYFVKRIADQWFNHSWKFTLSTLLMLSILNIKADTYAFPGIMLVLLMFLSLFGKSGKNKILFNKNEKL